MIRRLKRRIKWKIKWTIKRLYVRFRYDFRILRLRLMYLPEPEDAMSPEEMLAEIKRKSKLT